MVDQTLAGHWIRRFLMEYKSFREQSPQTFATDFAPGTIEPEHRPFRIFFSRLVDLRSNAEPIAYGRDLSERNASLCHPEWARIHPEKNHTLRAVTVTAEINFVRAPGVIEWVVNVRDGRSESLFANRGAEFLRSDD